MAQFRDIAVNPADPTQRILLYSNGYVESRGGAPTVDQWQFSLNEAYQFKAPLSSGTDARFMRIQVTDWVTPSGYTLDWYGLIYPWGSAVAVAGQTAPYTGGPEYLFGTGGGVSRPDFGFVSDFMMDPANSGKGYFMTYDGDVHAVGTGVTAVAHYPIVGGGATATRMVMDFASKRYWILDNYGRVWGWTGTTWSGPNIGNALSWGGVQPFNGVVWGRIGVGLALYDVSSITGADGFMLDELGRVYPVGGAQYPYGFNYTPNFQGWEDIAIIDDGTGANPLRLVVVSKEGREYEFVVSTAPSVDVGSPILGSTVTTSGRPWVQWKYSDPEGDGQAGWDVRVFNSTTYLAGSTSEVQRITITGTPTGGTFTVTHGGFTTTAIAYNANAATVQAALEALPSIGTGNVSCGGGALPGSFVTCTFQGTLAAANIVQMTATGSFTGGSSPAVAITTTTAGVDRDPTALSATWQTTGTGQYDDRVQVGVDLANATYRAYVRVTDTSGLSSSWDYTQWVQNVTAPSTPTVTPTAGSGLSGVSCLLHVSTAGLSGSARFGLQYHDSDWDGATWSWVRGGYDLLPDGSGNFTIVDRGARFGVVRTYRAIVYIYDASTDAWNGSAWSSTATATLGPRNVWAFTNPFNSAQGAIVAVEDFDPSKPVKAGRFWPVNADEPIVISDGKPKAPAFDLNLWLKTNADRVAVEAMLDADVVLLLRDPFGNAFHCKAYGDIREPVVRAAPLASEVTGIRDFHKITIPMQTVKRPTAGPSFGPFADTT